MLQNFFGDVDHVKTLLRKTLAIIVAEPIVQERLTVCVT